MNEIEKLRDIIKGSKRIVFFGGAGVSTASGIPDFRSADGIYADEYDGRSPEEILSAMYFALNTEKFYEFYRSFML
ncbi:MAG: NAD-dependent protein deacylase, partial [Mogibacterium sp.]|nr:NAD-dependent protein deacylase [Mogibacterium sp.]